MGEKKESLLCEGTQLAGVKIQADAGADGGDRIFHLDEGKEVVIDLAVRAVEAGVWRVKLALCAELKEGDFVSAPPKTSVVWRAVDELLAVRPAVELNTEGVSVSCLKDEGENPLFQRRWFKKPSFLMCFL